MVIQIEDLNIGDEVLIACQTTFKRLRVKRVPQRNKEGMWKNTLCDIRNDSVGTNKNYSNYNFRNEEYNDVFYADLHHRDMWLINKAII